MARPTLRLRGLVGAAEPGHCSEIFVGIDVSAARNGIVVAGGERGREMRFVGEEDASEESMRRLVKRITAKGKRAHCSRGRAARWSAASPPPAAADRSTWGRASRLGDFHARGERRPKRLEPAKAKVLCIPKAGCAADRTTKTVTPRRSLTSPVLGCDDPKVCRLKRPDIPRGDGQVVGGGDSRDVSIRRSDGPAFGPGSPAQLPIGIRGRTIERQKASVKKGRTR